MGGLTAPLRLDEETDIIIEIAVIITNGNLEPVDEGIEYVIKTDKAVLDKYVDSVSRWHTVMLKSITEWENGAPSSMGFLAKGMPELDAHLHYRIVDVSSIKELTKRWYPGDVARRAEKNKERFISHRALDDIRASIRELETYRRDIFVSREDYVKTHNIKKS
ncbi:hypothetical protein QFC21_006752 [Naganishia friedmannii]|uniref:Uncharacterized protein n=1 Tax=Naganishia friedmannii TaxID=89922 RepID=A0ACC2V178_9TREE|nr:hypothetical protein QFC21_006752 [Naganishia friedmannii]